MYSCIYKGKCHREIRLCTYGYLLGHFLRVKKVQVLAYIVRANLTEFLDKQSLDHHRKLEDVALIFLQKYLRILQKCKEFN